LTQTPTLSQSFDIGDFIAPDILSVVDANVRAAAADIIERDGLVGDLDRIIDLQADVPRFSEAILAGLVPSMNPDEFLSYDLPEAPEMIGFDDITEPAAYEYYDDEPEIEIEDISLSEEEPEEADFDDTETVEEPETAEVCDSVIVIESVEVFESTEVFDSVDVEIEIPDLGNIEQTAASVEEDLVVEIPEVSRINTNLLKVKMDTLRFDKKLLSIIRLTVIIAVIAALNIMLIIYLFNQ